MNSAIRSGLIMGALVAAAASGQGLQFKPFYDFAEVSFREKKAKTIWMDEVPGMPMHFWVLDQYGKIYSLYPKRPVADPGVINAYASETLADFSARCSQAIQAEWGAWGIAFHPEFRTNKKFYIIFIDPNGGTRTGRSNVALTTVEEWTASGARNEVLAKSRTVWTYRHKLAYGVACMTFGQDGYLYIANSDYGVDSYDLKTAGRKILRIDVDRKDPGKEYAVPADNPFVGRADALPEIWSYGIRNVWGIHSHPLTGALYSAEIGQEQWEELNVIKKGSNGGWADGGNGENYPDGTDNHYGIGYSGPCHPGNTSDCSRFAEPFWAFPRSASIADPKGGAGVRVGPVGDSTNNISLSCIMGGRTFLGNPKSPLYGHYIFSDTRFSKLWAFPPGAKGATYAWSGTNLSIQGSGPRYLGQVADRIGAEDMGNGDGHNGMVNLGMDSYGNLYGVFVSWTAGASFHEIYRIEHPDMLPRESTSLVGAGALSPVRNGGLIPPGRRALTVPARASLITINDIRGRKLGEIRLNPSESSREVALPPDLPAALLGWQYQ